MGKFTEVKPKPYTGFTKKQERKEKAELRELSRRFDKRQKAEEKKARQSKPSLFAKTMSTTSVFKKKTKRYVSASTTWNNASSNPEPEPKPQLAIDARKTTNSQETSSSNLEPNTSKSTSGITTKVTKSQEKTTQTSNASYKNQVAWWKKHQKSTQFKSSKKMEIPTKASTVKKFKKIGDFFIEKDRLNMICGGKVLNSKDFEEVEAATKACLNDADW